LENNLGTLGPWFSKAALTNGVVRYAGKKISLPTVAWDEGILSARVLTEYDQAISLRARLSTHYPWEISLKVDDIDKNSPHPKSRRYGLRARLSGEAISRSCGSIWASRLVAGKSERGRTLSVSGSPVEA
jgi:hypothetical protein